MAPASSSTIFVLDEAGAILEHDTYGPSSEGTVVADATDDMETVGINRSGPGASLLAVTRSRPAEDCTFDVREVRDGRLSAPIVQGVNPSMSPDGRSLAYVSVGPTQGAPGTCAPRSLVVRDLASGDERSWTAAFRSESRRHITGHIVTPLQWSPDSSTLAYGTYDARLYVLDPLNTPGASIRDAHLLRSDRPGQQIPIWDPRSGNLVVKDVAGEGDGTISPLVEIDPDDGTVVRTLAADIGRGRPIFLDPTTGDAVLLRSGTRVEDGMSVVVFDGEKVITRVEGEINGAV